MEVKKRNRIIIILLLVLLVMAISAFLSQYNYATELQKNINRQDSILKNGNQRDSILIKSTKDYAKVITKYVSSCGFTMDNKSVSAEEIVKLINNSQAEISVLRDSLYNFEIHNKINKIKLNDSISLYKAFLSSIELKYGITLKIGTDKEGRRYITSNISKADSALAIFPFYRNKLRIDSSGNFIISYEEKVKTPKKK